MIERIVAPRAIRRMATLLVSSTALLAGCGAELPTSAELEGMDVAAAERRLVTVAGANTPTSYVLDGKEVTANEAKAVAAGRIASIDVKRVNGQRNVISIRTNAASTGVRDTVGGTRIVVEEVVVRSGGTADTTHRVFPSPAPTSKVFEGLVIIDGVRSTSAAMNAISPDRIVSVEVIKGAAGVERYGPEAAKGVISVTTRK